jgi:elongation factor P
MISVSEFRRGMCIRYNNELWVVVEFQHLSPGNWRAMLKTKLKNVKTGRVLDVTFRMKENVDTVRLDEKKMQFLYESEGLLYFMDNETYDQVFIPSEMLGEEKAFLKEGGACLIYFLESAPVSAELPNFVELKIAEAEPAVRGDSATNITKYATLETGAKVLVPPFIKEGDTVKIDTRSGKYVERMSTG